MCSKKPLLLSIKGIFPKLESAMNWNNKWLWVSLESPFSMGMKCWGWFGYKWLATCTSQMLHPSMLQTEYDISCLTHFVRWGMDHDHIRARVFAQWGNSEDDLEWAVRSCPVDSWMAVGWGWLVKSCHEMRLSGSIPRKTAAKLMWKYTLACFGIKNHPHCSSVLYSRWCIHICMYVDKVFTRIWISVVSHHFTWSYYFKISYDIIWYHMTLFCIIQYDIKLYRIGVYDMILNHVISCNFLLFIRFYFYVSIDYSIISYQIILDDIVPHYLR